MKDSLWFAPYNLIFAATFQQGSVYPKMVANFGSHGAIYSKLGCWNKVTTGPIEMTLWKSGCFRDHALTTYVKFKLSLSF